MAHPHSRKTRLALSLLGKMISARRKERRISETDLAIRAGISRSTLRKIEKGQASVAIGSAFEVAALLDIPLFQSDEAGLAMRERMIDEQLALLPRRIRQPADLNLDDDF